MELRLSFWLKFCDSHLFDIDFESTTHLLQNMGLVVFMRYCFQINFMLCAGINNRKSIGFASWQQRKTFGPR